MVARPSLASSVLPAIATLALALLVPVSACGPGDLARVRMPQGGVRLTHALREGATAVVRLRVGDTWAPEGAARIRQSLDTEVTLTVVGPDRERGGTVVRATFANVELEWGLPPSATVSTEQFTRDAASQLLGMKVAFTVGPAGEVLYMPAPPDALGELERDLVTVVLRCLEHAFVVVPARRVEAGDTWVEHPRRGRAGVPGTVVEADVEVRVDGMFRDAALGGELVRLAVEHRRTDATTTAEGSRKTQSEGRTTVLFSTAGHVARVEGEFREFDPQRGMTFRNLKIEGGPWASPPPSHGLPAVVEQEIVDPCDADYVGAETCIDDPPVAPGDPEAAPDTEPAPGATDASASPEPPE